MIFVIARISVQNTNLHLKTGRSGLGSKLNVTKSQFVTLDQEQLFLFEKSLIGVYCNMLYDFEERHGPFSCFGRIKANSASKNLNVTNTCTNKKANPSNRQICQICLPPTSSFL